MDEQNEILVLFRIYFVVINSYIYDMKNCFFELYLCVPEP